MSLHLFKSVVFTIAILTPPWVIYRLWKYRRPGTKYSSFQLKSELPGIFFSAYLAIVIALTVLPVPFSGFRNSSNAGINLLPLFNTYQQLIDSFTHPDTARRVYALENILGNILMFIPLGIFLPYFFPTIRSWQRVAIPAFALSLLIELIQLLLRFVQTYRTVDIDDIVLNTLGAVLGFAFYETLFRKRRQVNGSFIRMRR